jgi:hypothetical protein
MQAMQDEFARWASDLLKLKGEVMVKKFQPDTFMKMSGVEQTQDAPLAQQAVQLLQSKWSEFRIEVKPENVALKDFAAEKDERTEVLLGISQFFQAMGAVVQFLPMPALLQILQWYVAGMRGSSGIESVLDQAVAQAEQAAAQKAAQPPQPPPPDPKVLATQVKAQADLQKTQADLQADLVRTQAETQAKNEQEQNQARANVAEAAAKLQLQRTAKAFEPQGPRQPNGGIPR